MQEPQRFHEVPPPGRFLADVAHLDGQTVVRFIGELDLAGVVKAEQIGRYALAMDVAGPLVVDVSELCFCDSAGLRTLVRLDHAATDAGRTLRLRRPSAAVRRVIDLMSLNLALAIEE